MSTSLGSLHLHRVVFGVQMWVEAPGDTKAWCAVMIGHSDRGLHAMVIQALDNSAYHAIRFLCMQVTIANAISWRYTVWLCVFGVLGLIPFATVRAHNNPPVAKSVGACTLP